ncbi:MAG: DNA phosphorothioation-associated putative methyltransferase [Spirochaetota bacterium]
MASNPDIFTEVARVPIGKRIGQTLYLHRSVKESTLHLGDGILSIAEEKLPSWNCIKYSSENKTISFLQYKDFEGDPHPILVQALTIHTDKLRSRHIRYREDHNPPILHRKELLVGPSHPFFMEWAAKTAEEEALGLYENTRTIGFLDNWKELLIEKGIAASGMDEPATVVVDRHRTAISRSALSKPVQALLSAGILTKERSFFDYGCGRGDDITALSSAGYQASGWDPVHRPAEAKREADVVNLGFVINVIENPSERIKVLHDAFTLAHSTLCVSALVENMQTAVNLKPFKDGYLTSRNTFQKYFNQGELAQLLEDALQKPSAASISHSGTSRSGFL